MKTFGGVLFVSLALVGCGGRAELEPVSGEGGAPSGNAGHVAGTAGSAGKGSSQGAASGGPLAGHELESCVPGFNRADAPGRPCTWLTEAGECFDEKEKACACACPQTKSSVCSSPFPGGPGSMTPVFCY